MPLHHRLRHDVGVFLWNRGARFYGWMTGQPTWRAHCARLADHFPPRPAGERLAVLDLGIGPGVSGFGILDRRPDAWVVGLDYSAAMLGETRRRAAAGACPAGALALVRGDGLRLPFADASFDVVTHHSFLYLLADRDRALEEIRRVLRPGGAYVLLEPRAGGSLGRVLVDGHGGRRFKLSMMLWRAASRGMGRFAEGELAALLERHGFASVRVAPTLGGLGLFVHASR